MEGCVKHEHFQGIQMGLVLEAKFHRNPDNIEVVFSSMAADLCNELLIN